MRKDNTVYLRHMMDAIERIQSYMEGVTETIFQQNLMLQDAVLRQLMVIGEACRNAAPEFQAAYSEIPWSNIISFRNRIIHGYFNVNLQAVWEITQNDLIPLKEQLGSVLSKFPPFIP